MAVDDLIHLYSKLEALGLDEVERKLAQGVYGERKRLVVEQWVAEKHNAMSAPTYMYHPKLAPNGQIFEAREVSELEKNGWFDSPAKFKKSPRRNSINKFVKSVRKDVAIGLFVTVVGGIILVIILSTFSGGNPDDGSSKTEGLTLPVPESAHSKGRGENIDECKEEYRIQLDTISRLSLSTRRDMQYEDLAEKVLASGCFGVALEATYQMSLTTRQDMHYEAIYLAAISAGDYDSARIAISRLSLPTQQDIGNERLLKAIQDGT